MEDRNLLLPLTRAHTCVQESEGKRREDKKMAGCREGEKKKRERRRRRRRRRRRGHNGEGKWRRKRKKFSSM